MKQAFLNADLPTGRGGLLIEGETIVAVGKDVVPRLITAVASTAPAGVGGVSARNDHAQRGADDQGKPFHRDSFCRFGP